jgi:16S rRNA (guanine(1405)-N(7))-methyltransferase
MSDIDLIKIISDVQKNPRYAAMDTALVESVVKDMLKKGFSTKETIKRARAKLHQVGGAYQEKKIPYDQLIKELKDLPMDLQSDSVKAFCNKAMEYHRSTEERLNLLDSMYKNIFAQLPPVKSILDIACGFNPFTLPWMPIAKDASYYACDIYPQMIGFINAFLNHFNVKGEAFTCDLTQSTPQHPVDLAIVLKTIPCLEQLDKSIGTRLLNQLNTKAVLISFPVRSLTGRVKDMPRFYEEHFMEIAENTEWNVKKIPMVDELFFLLQK